MMNIHQTLSQIAKATDLQSLTEALKDLSPEDSPITERISALIEQNQQKIETKDVKNLLKLEKRIQKLFPGNKGEGVEEKIRKVCLEKLNITEYSKVVTDYFSHLPEEEKAYIQYLTSREGLIYNDKFSQWIVKKMRPEDRTLEFMQSYKKFYRLLKGNSEKEEVFVTAISCIPSEYKTEMVKSVYTLLKDIKDKKHVSKLNETLAFLPMKDLPQLIKDALKENDPVEFLAVKALETKREVKSISAPFLEGIESGSRSLKYTLYSMITKGENIKNLQKALPFVKSITNGLMVRNILKTLILLPEDQVDDDVIQSTINLSVKTAEISNLRKVIRTFPLEQRKDAVKFLDTIFKNISNVDTMHEIRDVISSIEKSQLPDILMKAAPIIKNLSDESLFMTATILETLYNIPPEDREDVISKIEFLIKEETDGNALNNALDNMGSIKKTDREEAAEKARQFKEEKTADNRAVILFLGHLSDIQKDEWDDVIDKTQAFLGEVEVDCWLDFMFSLGRIPKNERQDLLNLIDEYFDKEKKCTEDYDIIIEILEDIPKDDRAIYLQHLDELIEGIADPENIRDLCVKLMNLSPTVAKLAVTYLRGISDSELILSILQSIQFIPPEEMETFFVLLKTFETIPDDFMHQIFERNPDFMSKSFTYLEQRLVTLTDPDKARNLSTFVLSLNLDRNHSLAQTAINIKILTENPWQPKSPYKIYRVVESQSEVETPEVDLPTTKIADQEIKMNPQGFRENLTEKPQVTFKDLPEDVSPEDLSKLFETLEKRLKNLSKEEKARVKSQIKRITGQSLGRHKENFVKDPFIQNCLIVTGSPDETVPNSVLGFRMILKFIKDQEMELRKEVLLTPEKEKSLIEALRKEALFTPEKEEALLEALRKRDPSVTPEKEEAYLKELKEKALLTPEKEEAYLDDLRKEALLTPQEEALLKMSTSIQFCPTGKSEGIALAYNQLPVSYKTAAVDMETGPQERGKNYVDQLVQETLTDLLSSKNALIKELTGDDYIGQLSHQALYVKNLIGSRVGLDHQLKFDLHTYVLFDLLITRDLANVLEVFYKHFTPELLVQKLVDAANRELRKQTPRFTENLMALTPSKAHPTMWGLDYDDDDNEVYTLTEEGAVEILKSLGYLTN